MTLKGGKNKLVARKEYPHICLIQSLQQLLQDPATIENCNHWKVHCSSEGVYSDVYDGKIWKESLSVNNSPFLSSENVFGLMLTYRLVSAV